MYVLKTCWLSLWRNAGSSLTFWACKSLDSFAALNRIVFIALQYRSIETLLRPTFYSGWRGFQDISPCYPDRDYGHRVQVDHEHKAKRSEMNNGGEETDEKNVQLVSPYRQWWLIVRSPSRVDRTTHWSSRLLWWTVEEWNRICRYSDYQNSPRTVSWIQICQSPLTLSPYF